MANEKHVALLKQGIESWNAWRKENPDNKIDLREANLYNTDLFGANLRGADLYNAELSSTDLRFADLHNTNLQSAYLHSADLRNAILRNANLSYINLCHADLREAMLCEANLSGAYLSYANFCDANLSGANLRDAELFGAQVLRTNLTGVILTGACIADWQINSSTVLEQVECDYIFRTYTREYSNSFQFSARLPVDPKNVFAPGEFTQRFQIIASAQETIDLTFTEGVDWQAFFQSFQELKQQYPDKNIAVQAMEEKGEAFIVRLKVNTEETGLDLEELKANIETTQKHLYSTQLSLKEAQGEIRVYREMMGVVKTLAGRPMGDQNFYAPVGNVAKTNQGNMQNIQHIYAPEQKDLSEAAKEIQTLLNTLAETYNTTTDTGKEKLMKELGQEVKQHPKWRRALKEGGIELIKVLCAPIGVPLEMARVYLEDE